MSETWLSQVYREIRNQDLLCSSGLPAKLLRGPEGSEEFQSLRGFALIEMLIEFDGIGWSFNVSWYLFLPHDFPFYLNVETSVYK